MTQHERPDKGKRWFATVIASSFLAMGTVHLAMGLITTLTDRDDQTVGGALFLVMALLVALLVRWRKWPHVRSDDEMRPATARRVLAGVTAAYALLTAVALIEGVVDRSGLAAMQVIAFGTLALIGTRVLTRAARRPTP